MFEFDDDIDFFEIIELEEDEKECKKPCGCSSYCLNCLGISNADFM